MSGIRPEALAGPARRVTVTLGSLSRCVPGLFGERVVAVTTHEGESMRRRLSVAMAQMVCEGTRAVVGPTSVPRCQLGISAHSERSDHFRSRYPHQSRPSVLRDLHCQVGAATCLTAPPYAGRVGKVPVKS